MRAAARIEIGQMLLYDFDIKPLIHLEQGIDKRSHPRRSGKY